MKPTANEARNCPRCGKPMPGGVLVGLCPACLLAQTTETEQGAHHFEAPPAARIAQLFPQLEILGLLGAGGMGAVYKARQPALDRIVALKILPTGEKRGSNFAERFNREARALARLSHPNIVAVYEFGQAGELSFFIMEYVDGANLRQLERGGRIAPREALQIIPQICDALQYAHDEGVVHRDIKPENVLVDRKGRVKIADFGLAKIVEPTPESLRLTAEGQVMGTPHYMAPEQVEHPLEVDHRADIYSLGVVFYEMLTGELPLGKFPPPSRKVQVDVRLDEVVLRSLENDPERRYQKAGEVKSSVETIATTPTSDESRPPGVEPEQYVWWAGFPLVAQRNLERRLHWGGVLRGWAVLFGLLTVGFGMVSLATSHSLLGWLGVVGWPSLVARGVVAALMVSWGVRRAYGRPPEETAPRAPQGTAVLLPTRFSRKALAGACWAPLFVVALGFVAAPRTIVAGATVSPPWWQTALSFALLPLGLAAPLGTTMLGWSAVGDIRRFRNRVRGLGLAVFDGLVFPVLALNAVLIWLCVKGLRTLGGMESLGSRQVSAGSLVALASTVLVCLVVDALIIRRAWRAVRAPDPGTWAGRNWLSAAQWNAGDGVALGLACLLVVGAVAGRHSESGRFGRAPSQVAITEEGTGISTAKLTPSGTVEVLAVSNQGAQANEWWRPDGTPIPDTLFELDGGQKLGPGKKKVNDIIFRWQDLPEGVSGPQLLIKERKGSSYAGGQRVLADGRPLNGSWPVRAGFPEEARTATLRLGFGLEPWRLVSSHGPNGSSRVSNTLPGMGAFQPRVHQVSERAGQAVLTVIMERDNPDWTVRVVAVDTNGVQHSAVNGTGTPVEGSSIWTYTFFNLALAAVKEFQVQARPIHWVEFRGIALEPKDRQRVGKSARVFRPTTFGPTREVHITDVFDFDTGASGLLADAQENGHPAFGAAAISWWAQVHKFDAIAETNALALLQVQLTDVPAAEWDSLRPTDLGERLSYSLYAPPRLPSTPGAKPPLTHIFRTREGATGLLQILALNGHARDVRLRYKLIEWSHFE